MTEGILYYLALEKSQPTWVDLQKGWLGGGAKGRSSLMPDAEKNECSHTCLLAENSKIRGSIRQKPTLIVSVVTDLEAVFLSFKSFINLRNLFPKVTFSSKNLFLFCNQVEPWRKMPWCGGFQPANCNWVGFCKQPPMHTCVYCMSTHSHLAMVSV